MLLFISTIHKGLDSRFNDMNSANQINKALTSVYMRIDCCIAVSMISNITLIFLKIMSYH